MKCPRCTGLIIIPAYYSDDDPKCCTCSRLYPDLKPVMNGARPRRGLRDTIRYSGSEQALKGMTCVIRFKSHPSVSVMHPLLEISCPWCDGIGESKDSTTNPAIAGYRRGVKRYAARALAQQEAKRYAEIRARTGDESVSCPSGHRFKLKIDSKGVYSWE